MPIRQLAPDVAAKIAAGEVVERPASVVKELIENSIDAGATQIRVDLMHGGLQLIRVIDNGSGIAADELPLALARHATSKVTLIDDLEHICSLGFRGEALASIAAVAEVSLISRTRAATQGAQISALNGQYSPVTAAASSEGTTLTVRNLFSAVPARLKFLKSRTTEVSHCHHLLEQYALAYPEIRFAVTSEGRQIFATAGDGKLFSVLVEIYGVQIAEQMVPIMGATRAGDTEHPVVTGYTSRPTCYKSTRQHISFFVNRRWVLSRMLTSAVEGAYHSLLLTGRHPIAVVNIEIDPTLLDVNVHPAKTEIRFLKERRVFSAILRAIREALLEEPQMPSWEGHNGSRPPDKTSSNEEDDDILHDIPGMSDEPSPAPRRDRLSASAADQPDQPDQPSASAADEEEETAYPRDNPWLTVTEEETGTHPPISSRLWQSHIHPTASGRATSAPTTSNAPVEADSPHPSVETDVARPQNDSSHPSVETAKQQTHLPRLRVVGQLSQSYIVTEGEDGMYLIDQHAAHERILLERMVATLKARAPITQHLLTAITLDLAPHQLESLEEHRQQLEQIGFALESADDGTIAVHAVPSVLVKYMNTRSLLELLLELTAAENLGNTETWEERALANVACKAAIKANYFLTVSEMREMLEQLEQTQSPYSCCHGRPTMVHFSLSALEREFGRR